MRLRRGPASGPPPVVEDRRQLCVYCGGSGGRLGPGDAHEVTLSDVERFCAEARRQGATGEVVVKNVLGAGPKGPVWTCAYVEIDPASHPAAEGDLGEGTARVLPVLVGPLAPPGPGGEAVDRSPEPDDHGPVVEGYGRVAVRCGANGPEVEVLTPGPPTALGATLVDLERFCAEARRQGVPDAALVWNVYGVGEMGRTSVGAYVEVERPLARTPEEQTP